MVSRYGQKRKVKHHAIVSNPRGLLAADDKFSVGANKVLQVIFARTHEIHYIARVEDETASFAFGEHLFGNLPLGIVAAVIARAAVAYD